MWNKISMRNMLQPKTLQCYTAQVIVDREIPTDEIPGHLQEDMIKLKQLKHLKTKEECLEQKLQILEVNVEFFAIEAHNYDSLAYEALPDFDVADGFIETRNAYLQRCMQFEAWIESTKLDISERDLEEELLLGSLPEEYKNITFNVDVIEYDIDDSVEEIHMFM